MALHKQERQEDTTRVRHKEHEQRVNEGHCTTHTYIHTYIHTYTRTHTLQTADSRHQTSDIRQERRGEALVLTEEQALLVHDVGPHADSQARQGSEQRAGERHGEEQQQERKRRRLLRK